MFTNEDCLPLLQECMHAAEIDFKIVLFWEGENIGFPRFASYLEENQISIDEYNPENTDDVDSTCLICFNAGNKAVCLSHYGMIKQSERML